jgi:hypothetical protein
MKPLGMRAATVALLAMLGATAPAANGKGRCHEIDADFTSELASGDPRCTSPSGLCAAGVIRHDALLKGAMFVSIDDSAPSAGMAASEPPSMLSVSGTRTLTPARGGTLTAHVVGVLDTTTFVFTEINVITGGTGRFAGAAGTLYVNGAATSATSFAGGIQGRICVP